jgi:hypothetical protein
MAKYLTVGIFLGALIVGACWAGVAFSGMRTGDPLTSQMTPGVRSPEGNLTVSYRFRTADNVAQLDGVTSIDFYPECIVVQYKQGSVSRGQVLFTDQITDLHWMPSP